MRFLPGLLAAVLLAAPTASGVPAAEPKPAPTLADRLQAPLAEHPGRSGLYILEKGEESLLARGWLADHATRTIEVQYFIWSTDNVGILASEALLRAAERGVSVRVLVDDLLVDAPPEAMIALARHPNVDIRIYNPKHKVGTSTAKRVVNVLTDFRGVNQRMHDKTAIFDGLAGITGGRNMADEYYDFDQAYTFRDRDALVMGPAVAQMRESFERFWESRLAVPVESLLGAKARRMTAERATQVCAELHAYARNPKNFAPEVRRALEELPLGFDALLREIVWEDVTFLSDLPGKNDGTQGLGGGGRTTAALLQVVREAEKRVTIQSPYLVLTKEGLSLFRSLVRRGVDVRVVTNSLAATDNLQAFSGYRKQRRALLAAGVRLREFRPDPAIRRELIARYPKLEKRPPVFAIHAKTLVVDGETLFVGTFNLDPRSVNLNTEVGLLVKNPALASQVERRIEQDMRPENSWDPAREDPDRRAPRAKRQKLKFWKALPLGPIL